MDPVLISIITSALGEGLWDVGKGLLSATVKDPALRPVTLKLEQFLQHRYEEPEKDEALLNAVQTALARAGAPTDDEDDLRRWLKNVSLDRLTAKKNHALRRQVARAVLAFTDAEADPPQDLMVALGWPRSRRHELSKLLAALRAQFYTLEDWRAPIEYANDATRLDLLRGILAHQSRLDNLMAPSVLARPPLPATTHVLSFDRLSPQDFERLCLWLVEDEGYVRGQHLGLAGSEQGRDVIAYKPTAHGEELWYFQCKRYASITVQGSLPPAERICLPRLSVP